MKKIQWALLLYILISFSLGAEVYSFKCKDGTEVKSLETGIVENVGYNIALGNYITVKSAKNEITYAHLKSIKVKKKQSVEKNEIIGNSGNTGFTKEACLEISVVPDQKQPAKIKEVRIGNKQVFPFYGGAVIDCGTDSVLGNYITIYSTEAIVTYYNLDKITISKFDNVNTDKVIATAVNDKDSATYKYMIKSSVKIEKEASDDYSFILK